MRARASCVSMGARPLDGSFGMPAPSWISTDDNLKLEYSTPRGNVLDGARSIERNIELLLRFSPPAAAGRKEVFPEADHVVSFRQ